MMRTYENLSFIYEENSASEQHLVMYVAHVGTDVLTKAKNVMTAILTIMMRAEIPALLTGVGMVYLDPMKHVTTETC